jgi:hypothetical protein
MGSGSANFSVTKVSDADKAFHDLHVENPDNLSEGTWNSLSETDKERVVAAI